MSAAKYRVTAPNPEYAGETGKCQFAKGVYEGPVEEGTLLYFEQAGYAIEILSGDPEPHEGSAVAQPDAEDLKGKALDNALKAAGLPVTGKADEKRAALAEYQASLEVDDSDDAEDGADDDQNGA